MTRGAQSAGSGSAVVSPAQAALWGFGRTVSGEHPELWGGLIDVDPTVDIDNDAMLRELLSTDGEDQIALRGAKRLAPRVGRSDSSEARDGEFRILGDATYLVTGATGGIGLHLIRWLTGRGARHIALVARREPSDEAASVFEELRGGGVEVSVFGGDVGRQAELAEVLKSIDDSMPALRGVFHLAGVVDDAVVNRLTWEKFERVFGPKVQGSWNLHELTKERALDVFAIFASGASFIGGAGQANYAAASAFQDALALHRRSLGLPAVSIDWGPWAQTGMARVVGVDRVAQWRRAGMDTIPVGAALRAFEMILEGEFAHVAVLPVDWPVYTASLGAGQLRPIYRNVAAEASSRTADGGQDSNAPRLDLASLLQLSDEDRRGKVETYAAERMAAVLGLSVDELDVKRPISSQGFDSIMAIELKNRIENDLGIIVPLVRLLDGPSAAELTHLLATRIDEVTQSVVGEGAEEEAPRVWEEGEI
jgi:NAD(P)-dependent dehydrogenase (short-subunit alcohol dehydrogenase family)/aryl carrier-like protein